MIAGLMRGWRAVVTVYEAADRAHLTLISAGVAFFAMFAVFPAVAALIAVFGLVADPQVVRGQLALMQDMIPVGAYEIFLAQIDGLLDARTQTLGWTTVLSVVIAIWSARAGVAALMRGLNVIHGGPTRNGLRHYGVALLLTMCLIGIAVAALLTVVVIPIVLAFLPLPGITVWILAAVRLIAALFIPLAALGLLYRFGPNKPDKRTGWLSPGSLLVVMLWLAASMGFSAYLSNFGRYNEVYGSIGAVIALLMWLYISAYLVLLGAVVNVTLARERARADATAPAQ